MNVIFDSHGEIVVNDHFDVLDVESSGGDISRYKDVPVSSLIVLDDSISSLGSVGRDLLFGVCLRGWLSPNSRSAANHRIRIRILS